MLKTKQNPKKNVKSNKKSNTKSNTKSNVKSKIIVKSDPPMKFDVMSQIQNIRDVINDSNLNPSSKSTSNLNSNFNSNFNSNSNSTYNIISNTNTNNNTNTNSNPNSNSNAKINSRENENMLYDKFKTHLHMMMKGDLLNSLQNSYFTDFAKMGGSVINIRYFSDMIRNMEETIVEEYEKKIRTLLGLDHEKRSEDMERKITSDIMDMGEFYEDKDKVHSMVKQIMGEDETKEIDKILTDNEIKEVDSAILTRVKKQNLINRFKIISAEVFNKYFKYDKKTDEFRINKNIKYFMTECDTINFTKEQKRSLWTIHDFIVDPDSQTFCFQGYAGTGKTTTIVEMISYLIRNKYIKSVAFAAPTNQAVNVIKNKFRPHLKRLVKDMLDKDLTQNYCFDDEIEFLDCHNIKINFITIHKLLMFKTDYSINGEMIFVRDNNATSLIADYEIVLIDECSMINIDMIDSIFNEIRSVQNMRSKGFKRHAKIMFTGDPAQLPPVNEDKSSIFSKSEKELTFGDYMDIMNFKITNSVISDAQTILRHKYKQLITDLSKMKTFLLKNVVRSRIDNVTKVCNEFRYLVVDSKYNMNILADKLGDMCETVEASYFNFNSKPDNSIKCVKLVAEGVSLYQFTEGMNRLMTEWFNNFIKLIKNGGTAIILTWTNRQTDIYNDTIRRKIFSGKREIKKFEDGDILMLSDFYALDLGENFVTQKLFTSEQIRVLQTDKQEVALRCFEQINSKSYLKMKNHHKINPELEMLINYINDQFCKNKKILCWIMRVHKLGEDHNKNMPIVVVDDKDGVEFSKWKSTSKDMIRNFSNKLLNRYKTCTQQVTKYIVVPLWVQWRKIFEEPFASVNYGYSITTHKAQGSSFHDTFVDLNDILLNPKTSEAYKCVYTAVTRTSNELHILI